jgi:tRNA threonylcarbamoyladenosine biosynthesis protein TsaE
LIFISKNIAETYNLASAVAKKADAGTVLALHGNLGSGKTCFVKGLAAALGIKNIISSPTFTIIQEYYGWLPLYHIDLYRLQNIQHIIDIGIEEYVFSQGITAIEWAERAAEILPEYTVHINFEIINPDSVRKITVQQNSVINDIKIENNDYQ